MDRKDAEALKASLEAVIHCLNVPMLLASQVEDEHLRRLIGSLAADVVVRLDYEIIPYIHKLFPQLKADAGE